MHVTQYVKKPIQLLLLDMECRKGTSCASSMVRALLSVLLTQVYVSR